MQAICDHKKRFLDISIHYGASASDLLAFEVSAIRTLLETPGFLAEGLCLFGDNAYVNTPWMATPYPNIRASMDDGKIKDTYNYLHSQLRITVECAFGILVWRWGFLRKQAPQEYSVAKIIATVSCLCRLHNFLIDVGEDQSPIPVAAEDDWHMAVGGAVIFTYRNGVRIPAQLMDGGHHFDDDLTRQRRGRRVSQLGDMLPREAMKAHLEGKPMRRPPIIRRN